MIKKILYVEISTAHTEIINSFVSALTPEYEVLLLINEKSLPRVQHLSKKIKIETLNEESYLSDILACKRRFMPDILLLNSAQGRKVRDLCLRLMFDRIPIVGVHHNAENIFKSFTQKIIHFKIKKYIVLADFIKEFLKSKISRKIEIESFYPLSYVQTNAVLLNSTEKYIAIPGVLEQDRRDYLGLVELVRLYDRKLDSSLKFVLLGNAKNHDGPRVVETIHNCKLESRFVLFDFYVEDDLMLSYVEKSLAVMPLLHPGTRWFDKYFETKISGSYSLAFAFNKPLLMHEVFKEKVEFQGNGVFYSFDFFKDAIETALHFKPEVSTQKYSPGFQKQKLLQFISSMSSWI